MLTRPFVFVLVAVFLSACGDEDYDNAKAHFCHLRRLSGESQQRAGDQAFLREVEETRAMLDAVIQGASDPDGVREKLRETTCP